METWLRWGGEARRGGCHAWTPAVQYCSVWRSSEECGGEDSGQDALMGLIAHNTDLIKFKVYRIKHICFLICLSPIFLEFVIVFYIFLLIFFIFSKIWNFKSKIQQITNLGWTESTGFYQSFRIHPNNL
jgi:hypothetical protein